MIKKVVKEETNDETSGKNESAISSTEIENLKKELEEAKAQAAENWDKLLRKEAELQNSLRRAEIDVSNARKYGIERLAQELLAVIDSFDQALSKTNVQETSDKAMLEGMKLTYKVLLDSLEKFGIKEINPVGELFNPQFHEAMMMQETNEFKVNQIITVVQKGFLVHERVLRPARVIVAREKISEKAASKEEE